MKKLINQQMIDRYIDRTFLKELAQGCGICGEPGPSLEIQGRQSVTGASP